MTFGEDENGKYLEVIPPPPDVAADGAAAASDARPKGNGEDVEDNAAQAMVPGFVQGLVPGEKGLPAQAGLVPGLVPLPKPKRSVHFPPGSHFSGTLKTAALKKGFLPKGDPGAANASADAPVYPAVCPDDLLHMRTFAEGELAALADGESLRVVGSDQEFVVGPGFQAVELEHGLLTKQGAKSNFATIIIEYSPSGKREEYFNQSFINQISNVHVVKYDEQERDEEQSERSGASATDSDDVRALRPHFGAQPIEAEEANSDKRFHRVCALVVCARARARALSLDARASLTPSRSPVPRVSLRTRPITGPRRRNSASEGRQARLGRPRAVPLRQ